MKQGDALSPLLSNFALKYAIRRVQVNQLLAYVNDVNILGGSKHTLNKNAEALVAATKEIRLEVLIKLSTWSCLKIRMQDKITVCEE